MSWSWPVRWSRRLVEIGKRFAGSGPVHRQRLANIDIRIAVSGVRGKSTAVRWLHDILHARGYDTYAKVTGTDPLSIHNGTEHAIERPTNVRLYENERQLRRFDDVDAAIVENQGIRHYTTRLVNSQYVRPQVVFLTNIREDHLDTLGENRAKIARALARSIPEGTHVVCGERDQHLKEYIDAELARRNATVSYVHVPRTHREVPGAELVYGLDLVLQAVDEPPLDDAERERYLGRMDVSWTQLPGGRVYNAAAVNDTRSVELVRRHLVGERDGPIQPVLYLREDRRGRTAAFLRYLEALADRGLVKQVRVVGRDAETFARHASFPVVIHDEADESPAQVLDDALADGWPVILMGNAVPEFMQGVIETIDDRLPERSMPSSPRTSERSPSGIQSGSNSG